MKPIELCILGCGSVARLHSRMARTLGGRIRLHFASRSLDKAEAYRKKFKGASAFGSYEAACASPDVDAVMICTPHAYHVEHVTLAAQNGKPILVEKPIARSLEELTFIEQAVAQAGVACVVAENYYFKPLIRVLRGHIEAGDIGEPLFIELNKTGRSNNTGWRTDAELMGGGALLEGGIHWVNLLLEIGGTPTHVVAARPTVAYPPRAPFEDNLEMLVKFSSGAAGKLLHSWNTFNRIGGLSASKIYGTEGNITFESNGIWALVLGKRKRLRFPGFLDIMGYRGMLKHFVAVVRDGADPAMSLAVARRDCEFVFAAYRALETGCFEAVSSAEY